MPRKTTTTRTPGPWISCGFNEAAARCRGKLPTILPGPPADRDASMRPRPDAAENVAEGEAVIRRNAASMRPRPDAAENVEQARWCDEQTRLQ